MTDEVKKDDATEAVAEKKEEAAPAAEEKKAEEPKKEEAAPEEGADVEVPAKFKTLVESIESMSVLDLNELVKLLEKKFGVSAAAVAVAAPGAAAEGGEAAQSTFAVELTNAGAQKIAVIKIVKEVLGLGLKEAKDMVDGAPTMLKEGVKKEEAEELKTRIEEAGGQVTLK